MEATYSILCVDDNLIIGRSSGVYLYKNIGGVFVCKQLLSLDGDYPISLSICKYDDDSANISTTDMIDTKYIKE